MRVILTILTGVAALSFVQGAQAQEKKSAPKEKARTLGTSGPSRCIINGENVECTNFTFGDLDSALAKRAAIGVQVSSTGSLRDTLGVFIARVTPKGPAETAGVVEGERIVSINGVDLRLNAADAGDSYASGLASRRLTRELQKATPGGRINLRVWSGGRVRDVQVTAGRASDLRERGAFGMLLDGIPGDFTFNEAPLRRMQLRNGERLRIESLPRRFQSIPRMKIQSMPRVYFEGMPEVDYELLPRDDDGKLLLEKKAKEKQIKL